MIRESRARRRYFERFLCIVLVSAFVSCRYFTEPEPDINQAVGPIHVGGVNFVNHYSGQSFHDGDGWNRDMYAYGLPWSDDRAMDVVPDTSGYQIFLTGVRIDSTELVRSNQSYSLYSPRIDLYYPSNMLVPAGYVQGNVAHFRIPDSGTHGFSFTYRIYNERTGLGTMFSYETPTVVLSLTFGHL